MPRRFDAHSWFRDGFIPRLLAAVILLMPIGFNLLAGATSLGALQGLLRLVCIGLLSLTLAVASWLAWLTFVQSITPQVQLATEVDQEAIVND